MAHFISLDRTGSISEELCIFDARWPRDEDREEWIRNASQDRRRGVCDAVASPQGGSLIIISHHLFLAFIMYHFFQHRIPIFLSSLTEEGN